MYKNITTQIFNNNISLYPSDLNKDIANIILNKIRKTYEGYCKDNCYVLNNSINIINRTIGKIETHENKNVIKYNIKYSCDIISPIEGEQVEAIVSNINKMGIIGYIKVDDKYSTSDNNFDNSPLIIIVPNDMITNYNTNDINIGQKLKVEILGYRIKFRNEKIQVVCKIV
jgi:DNA-directed RNA polymerase subunit E'/Rpb7